MEMQKKGQKKTDCWNYMEEDELLEKKNKEKV